MTDSPEDLANLSKEISERYAVLTHQLDLLQQTVERGQKELTEGLRMVLEAIRNK